MHYNLTTLSNGLRVISEYMPSSRSVSVGCWVDTGSRDETPIEAGASHFLEHLLFKGSERLTSHEISDTFDAIGAQHNAFTSKEYTCYWTRSRDADFTTSVEILGEMLRAPAFRQEEIDSERHVVLEEINMNEDDPTDVAHEQFVRSLWSGHPLSEPILGTPDSISSMTRATIHDYWARRYHPSTVVVAVAGHIEHDKAVAAVEEHFGSWTGEGIEREKIAPVGRSAVSLRVRDTEQAHLVLGGLGLDRSDDRRYALVVADHILGGGMSSRLFREVREKRGLAYAVHSFRLPFADTGAFAVYVGTTPHQAPEVLGLVRAELDKMMHDGVTAEELTRAKGHVAGALALSSEDANSRMTRLGKNELTGIEHLSVDEIVARVEAVDLAAVRDVAKAVYGGPYVLGAVGPFEESVLEPFIE